MLFNQIYWASNFANARLRFDNKYTCDHLIDASIKIIKYSNGSHVGYIVPQISYCIRSRNKTNTKKIIRLKNLLVLWWMFIIIIYYFSHHYWSGMVQPVMPNYKHILVCKLLVYNNMCFNCTNICVVQVREKHMQFIFNMHCFSYIQYFFSLVVSIWYPFQRIFLKFNKFIWDLQEYNTSSSI